MDGSDALGESAANDVCSSAAAASPKDDIPAPVEKVFYDKEGVFVHVKHDGADVQAPGRLRLTQTGDNAVVEWQPVINIDFLTDDDLGWAVITQSTGEREAEGSTNPVKSPYQEFAMKFALADVKSVECARPSLGWQMLNFQLKGDGPVLHPLHFHGTPIKDFWACLNRFIFLSRSSRNSSSYDVTDGSDNLLRSYDSIAMANAVGNLPTSFSTLFTEESLYAGFSKVTRFVRDLGTEVGLRQASVSSVSSLDVPETRTTGSSSHAESPAAPRPDGDFEVLECVPTCKLPAFDGPVSREKPIDLEEWQEYLDGEGRVVKEREFRRRLFKGGLDPAIRHHVWKFLLGYYSLDLTAASREQVDATRREEYSIMCQQWKSVLPSQKKRFGLFRERTHLINKDVLRTDRTHPRYMDDESLYLVKLNDILVTYCFYNFDLGYVQGMSDLCSPIVDILEDEVQSFWCFAGFLDMVESNFAEDQESMRQQLATLQSMLKLAEPHLSDYLAAQDSDNLYFCFRWLLVLFKRELSYEDTMRLWEVLWSNYLTPHFHLFCALALLVESKHTIISNKMGFNEIIKYVNELSGNIDLDDMLVSAEQLCRSFMTARDTLPLPADVRKILPAATSPLPGPALSDSLTGDSIMCCADGSALISSPSC